MFNPERQHNALSALEVLLFASRSGLYGRRDSAVLPPAVVAPVKTDPKP